jgi:hypothetical protein
MNDETAILILACVYTVGALYGAYLHVWTMAQCREIKKKESLKQLIRDVLDERGI